MAEGGLLGGYQPQFDIVGTISGVGTFLYWMFITLIGVGIIFVIIYILKYKHFITLKQLTSKDSRKIILNDRFAYSKLKNGTPIIKLLKRRLKLPLPPPETIETTSKGKQYVQGWLFGTDQVLYCQDSTDFSKEMKVLTTPEPRREDFKADTGYKEAFNFWFSEREKASKAMGNFQPYGTEDRVLITNELSEAKEWDVLDFWNKNFPIIFTGGITVLLIFGILIFAEDALKPLNALADKGIQAQQQLLDSQEKVANELANTARAVTNALAVATGKTLPEEAVIPQKIGSEPPPG